MRWWFTQLEAFRPAQIRKGARRVADLQREMDRARRERLQALGFEPAVASEVRLPHEKLHVMSRTGRYLGGVVRWCGNSWSRKTIAALLKEQN